MQNKEKNTSEDFLESLQTPDKESEETAPTPIDSGAFEKKIKYQDELIKELRKEIETLNSGTKEMMILRITKMGDRRVISIPKANKVFKEGDQVIMFKSTPEMLDKLIDLSIKDKYLFINYRRMPTYSK